MYGWTTVLSVIVFMLVFIGAVIFSDLRDSKKHGALMRLSDARLSRKTIKGAVVRADER